MSLVIEQWFDRDWLPATGGDTSAVSGGAIARSVAVGAMTVALALSGVAVSTSTSTGQELESIAESGVAVASSVAVGGLTGSIAASGSAIAQSASAGGLLGSAAVSGVSVSRSVGIGNLGVAGATLDLQGVSYVISVTIGDVQGSAPASTAAGVSGSYVNDQFPGCAVSKGPLINQGTTDLYP